MLATCRSNSIKGVRSKMLALFEISLRATCDHTHPISSGGETLGHGLSLSFATTYFWVVGLGHQANLKGATTGLHAASLGQ